MGIGWSAEEWALASTLAVALWAVLAVVVLRVVHGFLSRPHGYAHHLLDDEFARGELTIDEYERRRRRIECF